MSDTERKVAIVTGSATGVGAAAAIRVSFGFQQAYHARFRLSAGRPHQCLESRARFAAETTRRRVIFRRSAGIVAADKKMIEQEWGAGSG